MARRPELDEVLAGLNGGVLPSTLDTFSEKFVEAFTNWQTHKLNNPCTGGRAKDGDEGLRLRVRTKFRGEKLELPSIYLRLQNPPTREEALRVSSLDAWGRAFVRMACDGTAGERKPFHALATPSPRHATPRHATPRHTIPSPIESSSPHRLCVCRRCSSST